MKHLVQFLTLLGVLLVCNGYSAAKFPFPQQRTYPHGIMPAGVDHKHVQRVYETWLKFYYTEQGDLARVRFDTPSSTVSEGIGYGMIIMAYMDNAKNNTQPKFDKLWNYYKKFSAGGLMHWKINGFSGPVGTGAATDAELDAAIGLIMAHAQWGNASYLSDAKQLIGNIYAQEVRDNYLVGGSQWVAYNPSYLSTVAVELFKEIDGTRWNSVLGTSYNLLKVSQHGTTGLWPNWCDRGGNPGGGVGKDPELYGFDAGRTPWRLGWAYAWYGHAEAKSLCQKVLDWFKIKTGNSPGKIGQKYNLDGTINIAKGGAVANIPTFLGPLVCAGMVDASNQEWVDKGYTRLRAFGYTNDNYYNESLELLSMLLLTGNMPNLRKITPKTTATLKVEVTPPGAGTVTITPAKPSYAIGETVTLTTTPSAANFLWFGWDGDLLDKTASATIKMDFNKKIVAVFKDTQANDLVDDCEDNDNITNLGSAWFTYTDDADKGASTIVPLTKDAATKFTMSGPGHNSNHAVKVEFKLDKGSFKYDPYAGVGFAINDSVEAMDLSKSTGISFFYKGTFGKALCEVRIMGGGVTEPGADFNYDLPSINTWTEVVIPWEKFLQPIWAENPVAIDLKNIKKLQWQFQGPTGNQGELWLDDLHLIGYTMPIQTNGVADRAVPGNTRHTIGGLFAGSPSEITYSLNQNAFIKLGLFDLQGRFVATLARGYRPAGRHTAQYNIPGFVSGNELYVLKLTAGAESAFRKIVLQ